MIRSLVALALASVASVPASAASPVEEAQLAELDRIRAKVADEVQLAAYDLVDELVYGWVAEPVFPAPTPVVLAGVTVPVGLGAGMQALLENHIAAVLVKNPTTNVQLVHCPTCTSVVVHSGPEATVVSRGIDDPGVLAELGGVDRGPGAPGLGATGRHALFVDVEAEGAFLVLRARLTLLSPELPIVWSHTIATSASTPALLRQPDDLKSAAEARDEYIDALHDRGPITIPLRLVIRTYASPNDEILITEGGATSGGVPPPPFVWLQSGVEVGANDALAWTSSLLVGYSFIPEAYQGIMAQARVSRLVGRTRSHTRPDLYVFLGAAVISVWGPATGPFRDDVLTADEIITDLELEGPRTAFGALHLGLDVRMGNRIGLSTFLETMPDLAESENIGAYVRIAGLGFQGFGTEVTFCF
jgi:hypothetical protein